MITPRGKARPSGPEIDDQSAELEATLSALLASTKRFSGLLRRAVDGHSKVAHLDWTVSELGAHVLSIFRGYIAMSHGGPPLWTDSADIALGIRQALDDTLERDPGEVADALDQTAVELVAVYLRHVGLFGWNGGVSLPVRSVAGMNLAETEVHGWDLAKAMRQRWRISRDDALRSLDAAFDAAPLLVDPARASGRRATVELRLRRGPTYLFDLHDQHLTVVRAPADARADCHVSADPATYLLNSYGRIGDVGPALRGKVVVWGRRPWKALQLASSVRNP